MQVFDHLVDGIATGASAQGFVGVVFFDGMDGFFVQGPTDELSVYALYQ